ncbi:MAG: RNA pseudouridine synthase, partial [Mesorhizobium sp.]
MDDDKKPPRQKGPRKGGPAPRGDKPQFKRTYKPREAGEGAERGERPFRKGPRPEGKPFEKRDGARKPYTPRGDRPMTAEGERAERRFDRPKRDFAERPKRDFSDRPQRDAAPGQGGFKPRPRPSEAAPEAGERIAKRLARAGIASRRDAEELIAAGRVKVNGKVLSSPAFNV